MSNGDRPDRPPLARLLGAGARGADMVAQATGVDRALDDAIEEAVVRALQSEGVERAIIRLIERNAIQEAVGEAFTPDEVAKIVTEVLAAETTDRVVDELLDSPKFQLLLQRVIGSPGVRYALRSAMASQGAGIVGDMGVRLSKITERVDDGAERVVRRGRGEEETLQAGLTTRAVAGAVDIGLLVVFVTLTSSIFASILGLFTDKNLSAVWVAVFSVLGVLVCGLIVIGFWVLAGQTPGMRFLSIRLEPPDPTFKQALKRLLAIPVALGFFGLGFLAIVRDPRRRGWHDRFAGTEVVYDMQRRRVMSGDPVDPSAT